MDIGWWRDLVIIIGGVVGIVIGLVMLVLVVSNFRKTNVIYDQTLFIMDRTILIMDSLQKTASTVDSFTKVASQELIKPVIEIAALFQGLKAGLGGLFRRKE